MLVNSEYSMGSKQFKVPAMLGSILVIGILKHYALLHFARDLEATQIKVQREFELGHNTAGATKNICYTKGEGSVFDSSVTRNFHKILLEDMERYLEESEVLKYLSTC